jgi:hypothetical protein
VVVYSGKAKIFEGKMAQFCLCLFDGNIAGLDLFQ